MSSKKTKSSSVGKNKNSIKNQIENEETPKEQNKEDVVLNMYVHLKSGTKNGHHNCHCNWKSAKRFYCIPCKVSICSNCKLKDHKQHCLIDIEKNDLTPSRVKESFEPLKQYFEQAKSIKNLDSIKSELIEKIENTYSELINMVNKWKEKKVKEISDLIENIQSNTKALQDKYTSLQKEIIDYGNKNKEFFNLGEKNKDIYNSCFLMNYDLLTVSKKISLTVKTSGGQVENCLLSYKDNELPKYPKIVENVNKILFPNTFDDKYVQVNNCLNKISVEQFKDIEARLFRFNKLIDSFKKIVFKCVSKTGNYKEIEKENQAYEKTAPSGVDNLFSKRKNSNARASTKHILPEEPITKKEQVILNNHILNKHFAYLLTNLYDSYFKQEVKEMQSSHADLMIKVSEDEETDVGKVIEGTNQIMIYNKKTNRVERKTLNLTKNPFGYTKFPVGIRSLLIGDKFYITGGKDETQEYANVLIYDRKTDKIRRIMDMKNSRCYHTLIFNETFETLIVIGGEENASVEIFDPFTNRWQELPDLIYPRANSLFFFDEPRGMLFVLFGMEGPFINTNYSDVIEVLDLKHINKGWEKVNYNNKIGLGLKMHVNAIPLNTELILIYGGMESRKSTKVFCVLNLPKNEITNVDPKLMEELRREAKNNRKLSMIVASVSNMSIGQSASKY